MNEIQIFENTEFGSVRTTMINGEVWFVGKDVAEILGYAKPLNAIANHIRKDDSLKQGLIDNIGRTQETIFINESGLYRLIFSSKLPSAEKFTDWVTKEILPSIRQHGAYMTPEAIEKALLNPDYIINLATKLKNTQNELKDMTNYSKRLEHKIDVDAPKVEYHDTVINTGNLISITNIAKDLGYRSAQKLNDILVNNKIVYRKKNKDGKAKGYEVCADYNWLITEKYADYQIYSDKNSNPVLKFTEKGRKWIIENITNNKWKK